ncbi:hypothetical protein UUU_30910 [Klebsiella pneumoniae subsp. pneumoniae DSM 30104 = JCM 1662 = NBRC 14940]|nr:hypothetical protein UUU_30910 [Klebsiella pneumoniae subsp. pneumoniae DSM 30104 = JCM 1662 = NBRC 14940]
MVNAIQIFNHVDNYPHQKDQHQNPPVFNKPFHARFLFTSIRQATSCSMTR